MKKKVIIGLLCTGLFLTEMTACGKRSTENDPLQSAAERSAEAELSAAKEVQDLSEVQPETAEAPELSEISEIQEENAEETVNSGSEESSDGANTPDSTAEEAPAQDTENASGINQPTQRASYANAQEVYLDSAWQYADRSAIHSGCAVIYIASENRKGIVIGVNAGHGTAGGASVKTLCHPDGSAKVTGGSTAAGATMATAVSGGMTFQDGTSESSVTLQMAQILKDKLLAAGYDVLMLRDSSDVQLDNVARTVICNNAADCHISLHWDGDGLNYDKGCFYISVPDGLKGMEPAASHWQQHDALGEALVSGLRNQGALIKGNGSMSIDLTQTSYSTVPSVDIELGNACSDHSDATLSSQAEGLLQGINSYFGQ